MQKWMGMFVLLAGVASAAPGEKWGFIDKTGNFVIEPAYDECGPFSGGLAGVKVGDRWGFIDKTGELVVKASYDNVWRFSEGLAPVKKDGKWGYVDTTGKLVIALQFEGSASSFSGGRASIRIVEKQGRFKNGLRWIDYLYGFIDKTGKMVIPIKFKQAYHFSDGLACVSLDQETHGYIDPTGNWVIEPKYKSASPFSEGLATVRIAPHRTGYIDKTGKIVLKPLYGSAGGFSDGWAIVKLSYTDREFVIDKAGKTVVENAAKHNLVGHSEGRVLVKVGRDRSMLDDDGNLMPLRYWWVYHFSGGLARVCHAYKGPFGFIDKTGKEVLPIEFPKALDFSEGLAAAIKPRGGLR